MTEQVCAHLHVEYHTLRNLDGSIYGWWECEDCEWAFVPVEEKTPDDPLAAAKGIAFGCAISLVMWACIIGGLICLFN